MMKHWLIAFVFAAILFLSGCVNESGKSSDNTSFIYNNATITSVENNATQNLSGCTYENPPCTDNEECINNSCILKTGCLYNNPSCSQNYDCIDNQCLLKQGCQYQNPFCNNNEDCINNVCVLKQGCDFNNSPCDSDYECLNNQCILSFYERTRMDIIEENLPYTEESETDVPLLGSEEKALSLYGKFLIIYPKDEFFKEIAENNLISNYFCYQKINDYMGIEPDPLIDTSYIYEKIRIKDSSSSSASSNAIISEGSRSYWEYYKENIIPLTKSYMKDDICINDHEMTHLFVANTPLYYWLNEGLATYMEYKVGYKKNQNLADICRGNEILYPYYGNSYYYPPESPKNIMNLSYYDQQYPRNLYYYTGACFWYEIENNYDHEKLKNIMDALASRRIQRPEDIQNQYCTRFIEIFEEGLGEQLPDNLLNKYGLNRDTVVSSEQCGT